MDSYTLQCWLTSVDIYAPCADIVYSWVDLPGVMRIGKNVETNAQTKRERERERERKREREREYGKSLLSAVSGDDGGVFD